MTLTYSEKIEKALELAVDLDEVEYIETKIKTTDQINRRTKEGRELTKQLLSQANDQAIWLIDHKGLTPF